MSVLRLQQDNLSLYKKLMKLFAQVFHDSESYQGNPPGDIYIQNFLQDQSHIVLVAHDEQGEVVGGLVAYELQKFEQDRREIYIYDLAVAKMHQRQGIGSQLIETLQHLANQRSATVIFVQADKEDDHAISFYRKHAGEEIETITFDILPSS